MIERPSETRVPFLRVAAAALLAGMVLAALLLGVGALRGTRARAAVAFWSVCPAGCDYATIQGAVDAASSGDVIRVVGPNTYVENVVITKSLALDGGCANAACTVQAPLLFPTTVDGGGAGRVVTILGEPDRITVTLDGFVVTGGDAEYETAHDGGGIGSWTADLILTRNVITGNAASLTFSGGRGGGVYVYSGTVSMSNNRVEDNRATVNDRGDGGGVYLEHVNGLLADNHVRENVGGDVATAGTSYGGGLNVDSCDVLTLTGNTVYSNTASATGFGKGGGVYVKRCDAVLDGNTIVYNVAAAGLDGFGGGVAVDGDEIGCALLSSHNWILSNTGSFTSHGGGGGVYLEYVTATIDGDMLLANVSTFADFSVQNGDGLFHAYGVLTMTNGVVARNGVAGLGGCEGIFLLGSTGVDPLDAVLVNSTVVSNVDAGIECAGAAMTGTLVNLIVWGNGDDLVTCSGADLAYSDVEDTGDTGPGVIHQDPLFIDAAGDDYHLQSNSPCIDAGASPITYTFVPADDWDGDRRPVGSGYDVGADEVRLAVYLPLVLRDY